MRAEADTPLILAGGHCCRRGWLKLAEREHIFLCTFHHIIFDGWSSAVFIAIYRPVASLSPWGGDRPPQALPVQYADYASGSASGWRAKLDASSPIGRASWPMRRRWRCPPTARPLQPSFAGEAFPASGSEIAESAQASAGRRMPPFHDLAGGLSAAALPLQRPEDISVGVPAANRNHLELEGAHRLLSGHLGAAH
jgi:hypothetical protein